MNNEEKFKHKLQELLSEQDFPYEPANWEKAAAVLDKEEKKKKRFLIWFFSGIGLSLLILGSVFLAGRSSTADTNKQTKPNNTSTTITANKQNQSSIISLNKPENNINQKKTATNETEVNSPNKSETTNNTHTKADNNTITNPTYVSTKHNQNQQSKFFNTKTRLQNINTIQKPIVQNTNGTIQKSEKIKPNNNSTVFNTTVTKTDTVKEFPIQNNSTNMALSNSSTTPSKEEMPENTNALTTSATTATENTTTTTQSRALTLKNDTIEPPVDTAEVPAIKARNHLFNNQNITVPKNHFYIEAGAIYNPGWNYLNVTEARKINPFAGTSYLTGLTKKIAFSLGLYYNTLNGLTLSNKKAEVNKNGFALQSSEGSINPGYPGQGLTLVYGQEKNVTSITPLTLNYLIVPAQLQVFYKNNQAFSLGYSFAYLLNVNSKVETYTESNNTRVYKGAHKTYGYMEGFKTFCSQISVGYRRRLINNLWINTEVFYGLTDLRDDSFFGINLYERASGLKVSLTYDLLRK